MKENNVTKSGFKYIAMQVYFLYTLQMYKKQQLSLYIATCCVVNYVE
jgi:hypothetical protein